MRGLMLSPCDAQVAPNQYEVSPYFGVATGQVDNNLVVMNLCEQVAARWGLAALFCEKPFKGVNGSGKHNNWSLGASLIAGGGGSGGRVGEGGGRERE